MVFVEIDRNENALNNVKELVAEVERLTGKLKWEVSTVFNEDNISLNDESLLNFVQLDNTNYLSSDEFMAKQQEAKAQEEDDLGAEEKNFKKRGLLTVVHL